MPKVAPRWRQLMVTLNPAQQDYAWRVMQSLTFEVGDLSDAQREYAVRQIANGLPVSLTDVRRLGAPPRPAA